MDKEFGELRSILQQDEPLDAAQMTQLWDLIQRAHALDASTYLNEWVEYIRAHARKLEEHPLATCSSFEELRAFAMLAPNAKFAMVLHHVSSLETFSTEPLIASVTKLKIVDGPSKASDFSSLFRSPYIAHLESLTLEKTFLDADQLEMLLDYPKPQRLHTLRLTKSSLSDIRIVRDSQTLDMIEQPMAETAKPLLEGLENLDLSHNQFQRPPLDAWFGTRIASCCSLHLQNNIMTDEMLRLLAESPAMAELRWLDLSHNGILTRHNDDIPSGYDALLSPNYLRNLHTLDLSYNSGIHEEELAALSQEPKSLPALSDFRCVDTPVIESSLIEKTLDKIKFWD